MFKLNVKTEFGDLNEVVIATVENYQITEPVNITQEKYYDSNPPQLDRLLREQQSFFNVLQDAGIKTHWAKPLPECPFQVNTRDIAAVIGNTLVLSRLKWTLRRDELLGIEKIIEQTKDEVIVPEIGFLEGGDIIVNYPTIYVGLGERTSIEGYDFIVTNFGETWEIIPLQLRKGFLHLDVVFNIISPEIALIFPDAFTNTSLSFFKERFRELILITDVEQFDLATNVFVLGSYKVIADKRNVRVNNILRNMDYDVVELDYTHTSRIGGSFRCATLPLNRRDYVGA